MFVDDSVGLDNLLLGLLPLLGTFVQFLRYEQQGALGFGAGISLLVVEPGCSRLSGEIESGSRGQNNDSGNAAYPPPDGSNAHRFFAGRQPVDK